MRPQDQTSSTTTSREVRLEISALTQSALVLVLVKCRPDISSLLGGTLRLSLKVTSVDNSIH